MGLQVILLSKHIPNEEDLQINKTYVIYAKPTLDKKVFNRWLYKRFPNIFDSLLDGLKLQLKRIKTAFLKHIEVNRNWAFKMIFCEVLNLLNVLLQIFLTHIFLGQQFLHLGLDFLRDDFQGMMDTLDIVFPKVTKCHFHKFGASGSIQKHDGERKEKNCWFLIFT